MQIEASMSAPPKPPKRRTPRAASIHALLPSTFPLPPSPIVVSSHVDRDTALGVFKRLSRKIVPVAWVEMKRLALGVTGPRVHEQSDNQSVQT